MSGLTNGVVASSKRKRDGEPAVKKASKRRAVADEGPDAQRSRIEELERQITESKDYHKNVATLLSMLDIAQPQASINSPLVLSLFKAFSRLAAHGSLSTISRSPERGKATSPWLQDRYSEYQAALLSFLRHGDSNTQITSLNLYIRALKSVSFEAGWGVWRSVAVSNLLETLFEIENAETVRATFVETYLKSFDDWRFYTVEYIASYLSNPVESKTLEAIISLLCNLDSVPSSTEELLSFFIPLSKKSKEPLRSLTAHKRRAQEAWLAVLRSDLSTAQRKHLLRLTTTVITPWFHKPELLMDFLTDSYNVGGSTSLLALSGLFFLMQEKNLDYPQFYPKLYSLLDAELLHSKHRSRFFRLLDTFLASTHLPAALVASFMKRLSRLCLFGPPAAIVAVIPWIYNLLKTHPTTTFMLHRVSRTQSQNLANNSTKDPFNMTEPDPMLTNAIDSSLWEIETLQSHYHPNVASLARIISEQFTKQTYNVEDFLDHSYVSMLDAELGREAKKAPVVEWRIPRRIFFQVEEGENAEEEKLITKLWNFASF